FRNLKVRFRTLPSSLTIQKKQILLGEKRIMLGVERFFLSTSRRMKKGKNKFSSFILFSARLTLPLTCGFR
ncbi:MAG: hypothetical protein J5698_05810, partial [Bacteroidaceae bacterium]|nr:hypothetical protein [Bacteroidaceae bacterium]